MPIGSLSQCVRQSIIIGFTTWAVSPVNLAFAETSVNLESLNQIIALQQAQIKKLSDELESMKANSLTKTEASATYLTKTASNTFLTKTLAQSTYQTSSDAAATYLTKSAAATTYLTKSVAQSTYQTEAEAAASFLSKTDAAERYPTKNQVKNCALKLGVGLGKDATKPDFEDIDKGYDNTWESFWYNPGSKNETRVFFDWFCDF